MKIAIYRDYFDPINSNNISVICEILNNLEIDELWVVINTKHGKIKFKHRLEMCKKELKGLDKIKILFANEESDYDYLESFKSMFKNDIFYWVVNSIDFNKLDIKSSFLNQNKFIINQISLLNEKLLEKTLSYSIISAPCFYNKINVLELIKEGKTISPFISLNTYKYLKNIIK